jgi:GxxExxY protein
MNSDDYKHSDLTKRIIGVFYDVYNELGYGFLESVYQKAFALALRQAGLRVEVQRHIPVHFRGELVGDFFADLLAEAVVILELKATNELAPIHEAQLLNYLRATDVEIGLLLNFGPKPQVKRMVYSNERKQRQIVAADQRR